MTDNMRIWAAVPKTDMAQTQSANVDGNKQTAVSGLYMVKLATEVLGPIGECWGYSVVDERYDNTKPVMLGRGQEQQILKDGESIVWEQNHTIRIELWHGSRENTITQFGHTKFRYMKSDGSRLIVDNEAPKKSLTDALKKCLSLLGVCADVYMGMMDDASYREAATIENNIRKSSDADGETQAKIAELGDRIARNVETLAKMPNMNALQRAYGMESHHIDQIAPSLGLDSAELKKPLDAAYFEQQAKLENK